MSVSPTFGIMLEWYHFLLLVAVGFTVGVINTMAGGGSLLSLPILIFLGLPANVANGTNRIAIVIQAATATAGFKSKGVSTFPFNLYLGISGLLGAIIGAKIAIDIKGEVFNKILALVMLVVVVLLVFKPKVKLTDIQERLTGKYLWISILVFFFLGIYGGFLGSGNSFFMILLLQYVNRMSLLHAIATKVGVVFIYTLAALAVFAFNDKVIWIVGLFLALGNGIGAWVTSRFSVKKGDALIKPFLVVVVVAMAIKLWFF